ncbi:MAG: hypothetical protein RLO52_28785 [Sandaracinaceae bacterium]
MSEASVGGTREDELRGEPSEETDDLDALSFDEAPSFDESDPVDDVAFDEAWMDDPFTPCRGCGGAIRERYYDVDAATVCEACVQVLRHGAPGSSPFGRAARAFALGGLAAMASGLVWWGIRAATGYEIGLIAIAVGLAVGFAVRIGSGQMGGFFYQGMAMTLTYLAIVSTYVPDIMDELRHLPSEETPSEETSLRSGPSVAHAQPMEAGPQSRPSEGSVGQAEGDALWTPIVFVIACFISLFAPFLMGFENIIGLALIAFALWEAWRVNKRPYKQISGPFALGGAPEG